MRIGRRWRVWVSVPLIGGGAGVLYWGIYTGSGNPLPLAGTVAIWGVFGFAAMLVLFNAFFAADGDGHAEG